APSPHRVSRTSAARGSASTPSGHAGKRHRSPASGRGDGDAARSRLRERSGGESLATLRATPLQNHPTRAGRHPGAEAARALAPTHIGLIGPLHESSEGREKGRQATSVEYSDDPLLAPLLSTSGWGISGRRGTAFASAKARLDKRVSQSFPQVWRDVWRASKRLQTGSFSSRSRPRQTSGRTLATVVLSRASSQAGGRSLRAWSSSSS